MRGQVWQEGRPSHPVRDVSDLAFLTADHRPAAHRADAGPPVPTMAYVLLPAAELTAVAELVPLPATAVADALRTPSRPDELPQRTKYERHADLGFLHLYAAVQEGAPDDPPPGTSGTTEFRLVGMPVFVSRDLVVVVDHGTVPATDPVAQRWQPPAVARAMESVPATERSTAAVVHALLDLVVDSYLDAADALAERIDVLEDALFEGSGDLDPTELQRHSYRTRKTLSRLRRVATPIREVVAAAMRPEEHDPIVVGPALWPLYQDVYDHAVRLGEELEGLRDLLTTLYEARIAMADHVMNTVMKKLAAWAAIIAVPTAVTGFYGQNLDYPGFATTWGFVFSTVLWVGMSSGLFLLFRNRRWL